MQKTGFYINDCFYSILEIETYIWKMLLEGGKNTKAEFHTCCLGSTDLNGQASLRTVVLRKVDVAGKRFFFHTDIRSEKVSHLHKNANISVLFYDKGLKIQLNTKGKVTLHYLNEMAADHWNGIGNSSRKTYMTTLAPGTPIEIPSSGFDFELDAAPTFLLHSNEYYKNFMVIEYEIRQIDFLFLDFDGNKRALFHYKNETLENYSWLIP